MRLLTTISRSAARQVLAATTAVTLVLPAAVGRAAIDPQQMADAALASRFESLAEMTFPAKVPTGPDQPAVFGEQAALYRAAATLNPYESRYHRRLADALDALGDYGDLSGKTGELAALKMATDYKPDDEFSWNKRIDLFVSLMATADKQIGYLATLEGVPTLPPRVRAHAGARHAMILFDQDRREAARTLLDTVLRLNPLDLDALRLRYRLLPATATPLERAQALFDIVKANPLQPSYARQFALLLADTGLVQDSLQFFQLAVQTSFAMRRPDYQTALDMAAELYVGNQTLDAYRFVSGTLLKSNPNFSAAWYLDLLIVRSSGLSQDQQDKDLQRATVVMSNRVVQAINAALDAAGPAGTGSPRPTTRPLDADDVAPLPDIAPAIAAIKQLGPDANPRVKQEFVDAVADLARLQIYFAHKPDAARPLLDGLRGVLDANDPLLAQLQGLASLANGKTDEAMATLAPLKDTDPLAAMGIVLCQLKANPNGAQATEAAARKLLQDHPDGLVGAFLTEALSGPHVRLIPKAAASQLHQLCQAFPGDLFNLAFQPTRLYSVHVEPVDAGRAIGQPLLARVSLYNSSGADLTIGTDGAIHPGLMIQAAAVIGQQPAPISVYDELACPTVLRSRETFSQIVRVDQQGLLDVLSRAVRVAFQVEGRVILNPDIGIGGRDFSIIPSFARTAVNAEAVARARADLAAAANGASTPAERFQAVDVIAAFVHDVRSARNLTPDAIRDLVNLSNDVHRARGDNSPAVSAWAGQADFALSGADNRATAVRDLAADPDWRHRQVGLVLAGYLQDAAVQRQVVDQLQADPQPSVSEYAKAAQTLLKLGLPMNPALAKPSAAAASAGDGATGRAGTTTRPSPLP